MQDYDWDYYEDEADLDWDRLEFADPGGESALRAATLDNPRIYPCPTCGLENTLTKKDVNLRYQCDQCARHVEHGW